MNEFLKLNFGLGRYVLKTRGKLRTEIHILPTMTITALWNAGKSGGSVAWEEPASCTFGVKAISSS